MIRRNFIQTCLAAVAAPFAAWLPRRSDCVIPTIGTPFSSPWLKYEPDDYFALAKRTNGWQRRLLGRLQYFAMDNGECFLNFDVAIWTRNRALIATIRSEVRPVMRFVILEVHGSYARVKCTHVDEMRVVRDVDGVFGDEPPEDLVGRCGTAALVQGRWEVWSLAVSEIST